MSSVHKSEQFYGLGISWSFLRGTRSGLIPIVRLQVFFIALIREHNTLLVERDDHLGAPNVEHFGGHQAGFVATLPLHQKGQLTGPVAGS